MTAKEVADWAFAVGAWVGIIGLSVLIVFLVAAAIEEIRS